MTHNCGQESWVLTATQETASTSASQATKAAARIYGLHGVRLTLLTTCVCSPVLVLLSQLVYILFGLSERGVGSGRLAHR